jgi:hypothetical protein
VQRTPATFRDLAAGTVTIEISLDGYEPLTRDLTLAGGERRTLDLDLTKKPVAIAKPNPKPKPKAEPGSLAVRTDPYSVVYEGGKKLGETPVVLSLPAGTHTLRFVNPEHPARTKTVTITAGKTTKLKFSL